MGNVLKTVDVAQLTGSFATIYTVPGATQFTVTMLHLVNTSGVVVTVRICLVPSAGSPTQSNALFWDFSLAANDVLEVLKGDIWAAGSTLQALAGTTAVINIKLSGIETS